MKFSKLLDIAGVPQDLQDEALTCLALANARSDDLLLHKIKVRLLKAGKISKMIPWEAERLLDVRPDLARWDIAPMRNITAHGDNIPWDENGPIEGAWMKDTPEAREACYWAPGNHPRSKKARKAWYRRNGGEYEAWSRGLLVDTSLPIQEWYGKTKRIEVEVVRSGDIWIINSYRRFGPITLKGRHGFEIDNVFQKVNGQRVQAWIPLPGFQLRAPVTWSTIPRFK